MHLRHRVTAAGVAAAAACMLLTPGCATGGTHPGRDSTSTPSASASQRRPGATASGGAGQAPGPGDTPPGPASPGGATSGAASPATLAGWTVTVYYTAVERFHDGPRTAVTGCPRLDCTRGHDDLGTYPESFVEAVRAEGTGRTTAGQYLNWSYDTGYWIDSAPRDSAGNPLRPFESAAADRGVLAGGTRFTIVDCGHDEDGGRIPAEVCDRLGSARWTITDEFTPGLGGAGHVDVYIGEETHADFTETAWYVTLVGAVLRIG